MALKLYNTLWRKIEPFHPAVKSAVRLYTCGPTVYKSQHIGNYRTFIFEDVLKRVLLLNNFRVQHIMNITDVGHLVSDADEGEDKIKKAAQKAHKTAREIARFYENEFKKDLRALNILKPTKFVRATEHIKDQIKLILKLEQKGLTYTTKDGVYFNTSRIKDYGKLAAKNIAGLYAGARVAKGEKLNPTDFALWKFSSAAGLGQAKRQMEWRSPWGTGFPGWHIECSAMSMKYLGPTLDIHCGGIDHIQVHHSCEIAQSEAATGKPFARHWMHGAFLRVGEKKMAKSSPETNITLATIREREFDPLDFRYLALGTHYRKPLSFNWKALEGARAARNRIVGALVSKQTKNEQTLRNSILLAFNDDLNTPKALAAFWQAARKGISKSSALWADHVFGLRIHEQIRAGRPAKIPTDILLLAKKREVLRSEKRWQEADEIRRQIQKLSFEVQDTESGPKIHKI